MTSKKKKIPKPNLDETRNTGDFVDIRPSLVFLNLSLCEGVLLWEEREEGQKGGRWRERWGFTGWPGGLRRPGI